MRQRKDLAELSRCDRIWRRVCTTFPAWPTSGPQHGHRMSSCPPMSSCHRPQSQKLFRFNLDGRSVPEAPVNSFRILTPLPTRLNPPNPQIPFKKKSSPNFLELPTFSTRDPNNRVRSGPGSAGDATRAPGKPLTSIFKEFSVTPKCAVCGL